MQCPNKWIVGNGMDTAQIYRSLPYIGVLHDSVRISDDHVCSPLLIEHWHAVPQVQAQFKIKA